MKERIKELAEQAKCYADENSAHYLQNPHWIETFEEKFAELIIKETLQVARAGIEFGDGMEDAETSGSGDDQSADNA